MNFEKTKKIYTGEIIDVVKAANSLYYINICATDFQVKPGQFISILCDNYTLRRPFSVMNFEKNIITILFKLKGKGTKYLSNLKKGDMVDFSGPFGNGFNIEKEKSLIIGAGVGIAPVLFLKKHLDNEHIDNKIIGGFLNKESIPQNIILDMIATDDGSFGKSGSILNYIEDEIKTYNPKILYACGPNVVLKKVCELSEKYNIKSQIAMEKEMACSIGVCRGCVIELKNGKNASVCKDGPIFLGSEIKW